MLNNNCVLLKNITLLSFSCFFDKAQNNKTAHRTFFAFERWAAERFG